MMNDIDNELDELDSLLRDVDTLKLNSDAPYKFEEEMAPSD